MLTWNCYIFDLQEIGINIIDNVISKDQIGYSAVCYRNAGRAWAWVSQKAFVDQSRGNIRRSHPYNPIDGNVRVSESGECQTAQVKISHGVPTCCEIIRL